jgi:hypothetical protein
MALSTGNRGVFRPSSLTTELFRKMTGAGGALSAALVFSVNVAGPKPTAMREIASGVRNEGTAICPSKLPTPEQGEHILKCLALSSSNHRVTSFSAMKPQDRPGIQTTVDATAVNGQLGQDMIDGLVVPNGMYDNDPQRPVVPITDEASVDQSYYDEHGNPRMRFTNANLVMLNTLDRRTTPTLLCLIGGQGTIVAWRLWVCVVLMPARAVWCCQLSSCGAPPRGYCTKHR